MKIAETLVPFIRGIFPAASEFADRGDGRVLIYWPEPFVGRAPGRCPAIEIYLDHRLAFAIEHATQTEMNLLIGPLIAVKLHKQLESFQPVNREQHPFSFELTFNSLRKSTHSAVRARHSLE
ncbi:hypothetical protein PTE30175_01847 [Pandoraea terrae]|uniref:Uncharacterized protein n=1 Tax=Pandoraea terrae TaxID=1537710 RepID=A0A5E4U9S1_9BURK|nr:hypothetical protein [Pandoraea terrae]VVD96800.1 hypothetical protein PTE30175_01847 [Pandoraea terrae]